MSLRDAPRALVGQAWIGGAAGPERPRRFKADIARLTSRIAKGDGVVSQFHNVSLTFSPG